MSRTQDIVAATYPAVPDSVPLVRAAVTAAAVGAGATARQTDAARLAVTEAATNVVLHAYDMPGGSIHLYASLTGDDLQIVIGDDGCGMRSRPDSPGIGAGMAIIARSCDDVEIGTSDCGGSRLQMRFRVPGRPHETASAGPGAHGDRHDRRAARAPQR